MKNEYDFKMFCRRLFGYVTLESTYRSKNCLHRMRRTKQKTHRLTLSFMGMRGRTSEYSRKPGFERSS